MNAPTNGQQPPQPNGHSVDVDPGELTPEELELVASVTGRRHDDWDDDSFADRAGRQARQAWDQIQMAFPRLMGQPAYMRPRSMFTPTERPFDPDDLPLEADRSEEERRAATQLAQAAAAQQSEANAMQRGWRSVTRLLRLGDG